MPRAKIAGIAALLLASATLAYGDDRSDVAAWVRDFRAEHPTFSDCTSLKMVLIFGLPLVGGPDAIADQSATMAAARRDTPAGSILRDIIAASYILTGMGC